MDPGITAAIIGGVVAIVVAFIPFFYKRGYRSGFESGRRHSLQRFMDEQEKQLRRAGASINSGRDHEMFAIAQAIVDATSTWRQIEQNFRELLNGRIDTLSSQLEHRDKDGVVESLRTLQESFRQRRLVVERELERSRV